jgi:cytoskeleton protein RodZ
MSEPGLVSESFDRTDAVHSAGLSAGSLLRNAREAAGLHVAALAVSMKIPVKKLEALENDRLDLLHDAVFVRALAASVCRALKVDPTPVLEKLPLTKVPQLTSDQRGINAPFRTPMDSGGLSVPGLVAKPQVLIVLLLLTAIVGVFFFPEKMGSVATSEQAVQTTQLADHSETLNAEKLALEQVKPPSVPASAVMGDALSGAGFVDAQSQRLVQTSVSAASNASPTPSSPAESSPGVVVFKVRAAAWVKVVDAVGVVQLSRTLTPSEVVAVSGQLPVTVVVGRADAVDVEVRGKAFSLNEHAKENVARFEVK